MDSTIVAGEDGRWIEGIERESVLVDVDRGNGAAAANSAEIGAAIGGPVQAYTAEIDYIWIRRVNREDQSVKAEERDAGRCDARPRGASVH